MAAGWTGTAPGVSFAASPAAPGSPNPSGPTHYGTHSSLQHWMQESRCEFWYGFIIGDDWTVAAAVAAALVVTWLLHTAGVTAWWLPPLVAVAATGASLRRISG
jgi:hypothetical protein